jgi:hypothetical protein
MDKLIKNILRESTFERERLKRKFLNLICNGLSHDDNTIYFEGFGVDLRFAFMFSFGFGEQPDGKYLKEYYSSNSGYGLGHFRKICTQIFGFDMYEQRELWKKVVDCVIRYFEENIQ